MICAVFMRDGLCQKRRLCNFIFPTLSGRAPARMVGAVLCAESVRQKTVTKINTFNKFSLKFKEKLHYLATSRLRATSSLESKSLPFRTWNDKVTPLPPWARTHKHTKSHGISRNTVEHRRKLNGTETSGTIPLKRRGQQGYFHPGASIVIRCADIKSSHNRHGRRSVSLRNVISYRMYDIMSSACTVVVTQIDQCNRRISSSYCQ